MYLPYPNTDTIPVVINLSNGKMDKDGVPVIIKKVKTNCTLSDKQLYLRDADGRLIKLESKLYIKGDIAPTISALEGSVELFGKTYTIYRSSRPRQPDGKIHHTKLELI